MKSMTVVHRKQSSKWQNTIFWKQFAKAHVCSQVQKVSAPSCSLSYWNQLSKIRWKFAENVSRNLTPFWYVLFVNHQLHVLAPKFFILFKWVAVFRTLLGNVPNQLKQIFHVYRQCFMQFVPDRYREMLWPIIKKHIATNRSLVGYACHIPGVVKKADVKVKFCKKCLS